MLANMLGKKGSRKQPQKPTDLGGVTNECHRTDAQDPNGPLFNGAKMNQAPLG